MSCINEPETIELVVGDLPDLFTFVVFALGLGIVVLGLAVTRFPSDPDERDYVPSEAEMDDWPAAGDDPPE